MSRDRRLTALLAGLALVAVAAVGGGLALADPPPVAVVADDVPVGPDGGVTVQFVGDTMVGGALQPLLDIEGYDRALDALRPGLRATDFVIATEGAPITARPGPAVPNPFEPAATRPPVAGALARAGVDALRLAVDTDAPGLADTTAHAEAGGLAAFGAGPDLARAERPLLLHTPFGVLGVVGLGENLDLEADDLAPGMTPLSPKGIVRGAELARAAGADWVIATVHWDGGYLPLRPQQRYWAELVAAAGYDLVVGTGPRRTQPVEMIGSTPVIYSLGNFVYGTNGRFAQLGIPGYGLALGVELRSDRVPRLSLRCLVVDNRVTGFRPRFCDAAQARSFLPTLGPGLRVEGDRAVLACRCFTRREDS